MSTSSVRHAGASPLNDLMMAGPKLLAASLAGASQLLRQGSATMGTAFSGSSQKSSASACCCDIPEQDCPPRCVCEIEWRASAGEKLRAEIRFTNTSAQARNFQFSVAPFSGPGNPSASLTLSPQNATLQPGQSTTVAVDFAPTDKFQDGQTYETEVIMRGNYEQAVCLRFIPESRQVTRCSVSQGDPPVRIRAHQWYDHFQCVEPCFPTRTDQPPPQLTHQPH